jgi:hypothetical protein
MIDQTAHTSTSSLVNPQQCAKDTNEDKIIRTSTPHIAVDVTGVKAVFDDASLRALLQEIGGCMS